LIAEPKWIEKCRFSRKDAIAIMVRRDGNREYRV
jgi:hypothetical protein